MVTRRSFAIQTFASSAHAEANRSAGRDRPILGPWGDNRCRGLEQGFVESGRRAAEFECTWAGCVTPDFEPTGGQWPQAAGRPVERGVRPRSGRRRWPRSLAFQSISPGNRLEFDADSVLDGNHGSCLEFECGKRRADLVHRHRIVAVDQHMPTPLADSHHEQFDLEIGGRLPGKRRGSCSGGVSALSKGHGLLQK